MKETLHKQVDLTLTNRPRPFIDERVEGYLDTISANLREIAHYLVDICPESRELSITLTKLQEARMFAVAAVVLYQEELT